MAAKDLREAIHRGLQGPLNNKVQTNLEHELRDFFAHEVMKFSIGGVYGYNKDLVDFFNHIFKNVPATGGEK